MLRRSFRFFILCMLFLFTIMECAKRQHRDPAVEEVVKYKSDVDLQAKIDELSKKKRSEPEVSDRELQELSSNELGLKKAAYRAHLEYGEHSLEVANALHALGRNLYKQGKVQEVKELSMKIVRIHEAIDGPEHVNTANALSNVGSVAFKLGLRRLCEKVMQRALHIFLKEFGDNTKEVLVHLGRMMTFQIKDASSSRGITYDEYQEYIEDLDDAEEL